MPYQSITVPMARVYYNRDNPNEPFCLDFGPDTPSIVVEKLDILGRWVSMFDPSEDANPRAWMESSGTSVAIKLSTEESWLLAESTS